MKKSTRFLKKLQNNWVTLTLTAFLALALSILYINLGRDALFNWDEGIYAELGRELIDSGNLFVNSWNYSTWFEKPPGISWLTAAGQLIAGHSAYGARLFQPVVTTLVLYVIYLVGKELKSRRTGLMAMGFLLGFNLFLGRSRAVNTDMPLLLGIATSLYLLLKKSPPWQLALALFFSIWFKGIAGSLAILISLPLLLQKPRAYLVDTTLILLALIIPWHLYAYLRYGSEFYTPYLLEQVVRRATVPIEFHLESRWFYLEYLYENLGLGMIIGLVLGILSLAYNFLHKRSLKHFTLIWWVILPLTIFTLAKTRLFWYILPVYPAIALILAYLVDSFSRDKISRQVVTILAIGVLAKGLTTAYHSVEPARTIEPLSDSLQVVTELSGHDQMLAILVSESERTAEAVLPQDQRLSSSFRYGGMPSAVYYYQGPVIYFYNLDEFRDYFESEGELAMLSVADQDIVEGYETLVTTDTYLGITKGDYYAQR